MNPKAFQCSSSWYFKIVVLNGLTEPNFQAHLLIVRSLLF